MSTPQTKLIRAWASRRNKIIAAARKLSMADVGRKFGISRQRVRQIVEGGK